MIKSLEVELRDRAPFSYFDIVVFIFSERHALVDNIGKVHENILDLLLFPTDFCLEILDLLRNNLGLFHQCRGFLFLLSRLGDCRRDLVPFLPQLISFCLEMPPLSIELQYELHLIQLVLQAPLPQALPDYLGVLPHALDVQQDGFGLKILPVGKKPMSTQGVPRLFKDQDPSRKASLGITPARRSLLRSRQPHRQRLCHGRDRRLEMPGMPADLLRRQTLRHDRPRT